MATKLSRAKAMAAAYSHNTRRMHGDRYRNKRGGSYANKPRKHTASSMESDYWVPKSPSHMGVFRVPGPGFSGRRDKL